MSKLKQLLKARYKQALQELQDGEDAILIEELGLSTRAYNRCHKHDVYTVGDLKRAMQDPINLLGYSTMYKSSSTYLELREVIKP